MLLLYLSEVVVVLITCGTSKSCTFVSISDKSEKILTDYIVKFINFPLPLIIL